MGATSCSSCVGREARGLRAAGGVAAGGVAAGGVAAGGAGAAGSSAAHAGPAISVESATTQRRVRPLTADPTSHGRRESDSKCRDGAFPGTRIRSLRDCWRREVGAEARISRPIRLRQLPGTAIAPFTRHEGEAHRHIDAGALPCLHAGSSRRTRCLRRLVVASAEAGRVRDPSRRLRARMARGPADSLPGFPAEARAHLRARATRGTVRLVRALRARDAVKATASVTLDPDGATIAPQPADILGRY